MVKDFQSAINLAYFFLKFRKRTEQEVVQYLKTKFVPDESNEHLIQKVIDDLKSRKYIDDLDFIDSYVKDHTKLKPSSILYITHALLRLGIPKELITHYFSQNQLDDLKTAKKILLQKMKIPSKTDEKMHYKKLISYLLRKGFTYEVAKKAFEELQDNK